MDPIARVRRETKYGIDRCRADALLAAVAERLGIPSAPATMVRSVYFDAPDKGFAARAIRAPADCLKVRAKAYGPDGGDGEVCWVELKRQRDNVADKRRFPVRRVELDRILGGRTAQLSLPLDASPAEVQAARAARAAFAAVAGVVGPLSPLVAVRYQRRVQTEAGRWRLTVDHDIAYRAVERPVGTGLAQSDAATVAEAWVVVELKQCVDVPAWLTELLAPVPRDPTFSKFVRAVEATRRAPPRRAQVG